MDDPAVHDVARTVLATASEAYYAKNGHYPIHLSELQDSGFVADFGGVLDAATDTVDSTDPASAWALTYAVQGVSYSITSAGTAAC